MCYTLSHKTRFLSLPQYHLLFPVVSYFSTLKKQKESLKGKPIEKDEQVLTHEKQKQGWEYGKPWKSSKNVHPSDKIVPKFQENGIVWKYNKVLGWHFLLLKVSWPQRHYPL